MNSLPQFESYGNYSSGNYGAHCMRVRFPRLTLYFSYKTVVAFRADGPTVVSQNDWGPTTGKHLNFIDGGEKKSRVPRSEFEERLEKKLVELGLNIPE